MNCAAQVRYTYPGSGCVENAYAPGVFSCGCRRGAGGAACQYTTQLLGADPFTGLVDPGRIITSGGPPPIKEMPSAVSILDPVLLAGDAFTPEDYMRLNYAHNPQVSNALVVDSEYLLQTGQTRYIVVSSNSVVRDFSMQPNFAPYGSARLVQAYLDSGDLIFTNCPYNVESKLGQLLLLKDCAVYDPITDLLVANVTQYDLQGNPYNITWDNVTHYHDFKFRCQTSSACVKSPLDCASQSPVCGGNGVPQADGTCLCNPGFETFFVNPDFTALVETPYDANNPFDWYSSASPIDAWRYYGSVCTQRNCTQQDCSPPTGCDPGTAANNFQDADVACSYKSGRHGMCASSQANCA